MDDTSFHTLHHVHCEPRSESIPLTPVTPISPSTFSLSDDIAIIGGNHTGIFVQSVKPGSPAELCGLKEGSELLEVKKLTTCPQTYRINIEQHIVHTQYIWNQL